MVDSRCMYKALAIIGGVLLPSGNPEIHFLSGIELCCHHAKIELGMYKVQPTHSQQNVYAR